MDKRNEFYNRSMRSLLQNNYIEMYSTQNEEKFVVAERFIKTLYNKIYKYMASISKNACIDKLDDAVNKYINAYHSTIKIKPADVKLTLHILTLIKKIIRKILNLKLGAM